MTMPTHCKQEICNDCNIYQDTCGGEIFELEGFTCKHQVKSPNNTKSNIQIKAFYSLYRTKRRCGVDMLNAFVESIVQSGDKAFAEAKRKRPELIEEWDDSHQPPK